MKIFQKILDILNVHPDKNQAPLLISFFLSGLIGTYTSPTITKTIITDLPAEWLAVQSLSSAIMGLLTGMVWKGKCRKSFLKSFFWFATVESICGCLLGFYLAFINYNSWLYAICSLIYTNLISRFVCKCIMAFKAKLWIEKEREIYDNNASVISSIVCIIGFSMALINMPSLKLSMVLFGIGCIMDDIGWIFVYAKNKDVLKNIE